MAPQEPGTGNGSHLEIEIKLEAPYHAELPDLSGLPGVAAVRQESTDELDATYFDAADLRLTRAGITLRRRTGGGDAGWHLKLPAPAGARLEVHRPLGAQPRVVPPQLLALVRARLLGEPLAPVARIRTTRARLALHSEAGERLAEVADDAVTAEAYERPDLLEAIEQEEPPETAEHGADAAVVMRWREIEVELDEGDRPLLAAAREALLATMAKEAPAPSKLVRTLEERLRAEPSEPEPRNRGAAKPVLERLRELAERLRQLDPGVRLGAEGAVAELRAVVRSIDGLLVVFAGLFAAEPTEALRRELSRLGAVLERLHEADSMYGRLVGLLASEPPELVIGPVRERIETELGRERRQARIDLVQELNAPGHLALLRRLGAFVLTPPVVAVPLDPEQKKRKAVLEALTPFVAEVHQKIMIEDDVSSPVEQARLATEALLPVGGKRVAEYLAAARALEAALDAIARPTGARRMLLALAGRATRVGENAFTYGHLYAQLDEPEPEPDITPLREAAERWPIGG